MAHLTPLAAREEALRQALAEHTARRAAAANLSAFKREKARAASLLPYRCEVDAAYAVYDCAIKAQVWAAIAYDRAFYERHHGELHPGEIPWGSERVEGLRDWYRGEAA